MDGLMITDSDISNEDGPLVAVVQLGSGPDMESNLTQAGHFTEKAASAGADLVVLPENFAYMGPPPGKLPLAEDLDGDGPIISWGKKLAQRLGIRLLMGSLPERSDAPGKVYNTSVLVDTNGDLIAAYRKIHLFDVDVPQGPSVRESETMVSGKDLVLAKTRWGLLGLSICYDLRFPELFRLLAVKGAFAALVPAAFTDVTGEAHWEILVRARAIENLFYVAAANLWGHHYEDRSSFGHSMIVDPWGVVLARADDGPGVALARLDPGEVARRRAALPCLDHRAFEVAGGD